MYRTDEIAVSLTAAWVRNGVANKEPEEIAHFYRAVCDALEQGHGKHISKVEEEQGKIDSGYMVFQVASISFLILVATIAILFAIYLK